MNRKKEEEDGLTNHKTDRQTDRQTDKQLNCRLTIDPLHLISFYVFDLIKGIEVLEYTGKWNITAWEANFFVKFYWSSKGARQKNLQSFFAFLFFK